MKTITTLLAFILTLSVTAADTASEKYHYNLLHDAPAIFDATGTVVVPKHIIAQKYLILYFSASWCPPCHKFNPELIQWYKEHNGGKDVEIILVGSDSDTAAIKKYMKDQKFPWLAFTMDKKQFPAIKSKYGGKGIPCIAVLNEKDEIVAHSYVEGKYEGPKAPLDKYLELIKQ